jgi:4-alpha-glucanotransferase
MSTDRWGITDGYHDALGVWHETSSALRGALLAAMGVEGAAPAPEGAPPVIVVRRGERLTAPADVDLESGGTLRVDGALPAELPDGYHVARPLDGAAPFRLIVSPGRCRLPARERAWGWAVQLYAARSRESWGIGDLADLRRLAGWSARDLGADVLLLNPLTAPVVDEATSPYFPSSRRYRNALYLRIEEVPGAGAARLDLDRLAEAGRSLNDERRIDRAAVGRLKREALEGLWRAFPGDPRFDRYRAEQGRDLRDFAVFCALTERHGPGWRRWPAEHRRPDAPAVARFAAEEAGRVDFHAWLQWLIDEQLGQAGARIGLVQDLPIGVDPEGAEGWAWQDVLAGGVSVGAPPDRYNRRGQDWGLPPFAPHRLRERGYEPFVQTIRGALRHAGGLRIDHVMGLFRLFWIPAGGVPADGAYVRYPADDLLAILALESARAGAFVVGEDLGTVEEGVRERLAEHAVLSSRVLWFETDPPARYPRLALASVTTHDLPTVAGLWTGADLGAQARIGLEPNVAGVTAMREQLAAMTGLADGAPAADAVRAAYTLLGTAPSLVVLAALDDALAVEERPNMPGTTTQWPNWSLALPQPLEDLEHAPLARAIADALGRAPAPTENPP